MPRYRLLIEYDGAPFAGWQIQAGQTTVQGVLTTAVEAFCGEKVSVSGAGRTDAGVHALGQVAHIDLGKEWDSDTVRDALTAQLRPHPVAVLEIELAHRADEAYRGVAAVDDRYASEARVSLRTLLGHLPSRWPRSPPGRTAAGRARPARPALARRWRGPCG